MHFKSEFERSIAHLIQQVPIPYDLQDYENTPFNAECDGLFLNTVTGRLTYVEFKPSIVNTVKTIRTSINTLQNRCRRFGVSDSGTYSQLSNRLYRLSGAARNTSLENAWSNSIHKQIITAQALSEDDKDFLLIFKSHDLAKLKLNKRSCTLEDYYQVKYEINAMYLNDFEQLVKEGIFVKIDASKALH